MHILQYTLAEGEDKVVGDDEDVWSLWQGHTNEILVLGLDLDLVLDLFMLVDDDVDFEDDKVDGTDDDIKDMFMVFCISFRDRLSDNLSSATIFYTSLIYFVRQWIRNCASAEDG